MNNLEYKESKLGILYDTLFFCSSLYEDNIANLFHFYDEEDFKYYYKFKDVFVKTETDIPMHLYSFFYRGKGNHSVANRILVDNLNFDDDDVISSYKKVCSDYLLVRKIISDQYFHDENINLKDIDVLGSIYKSNIPDVIKGDVKFILSNIEIYIDEFISFLEQIILLVSNFHKKNKNVALSIKDNIKSETFACRVNYFDNKLRKYYSVCLLNPYVSFYKVNMEVNFILGFMFLKEIENENQFKHVNISSISKSFCDETRYKIFTIIKENGEITISDIASKIDIYWSSVEYHVGLLTIEKVVKISKINGRRIYYAVNNDYLPVMKKIFLDFLKEFE